MSSERVVELLKTAYADEIETVMNYQTNAPSSSTASAPRRSKRV